MPMRSGPRTKRADRTGAVLPGAVLLCAVLMLTLLSPAPGAIAAPPEAGTWLWPVEGVREVTEPFRAPAHDYGPGHRGMDLTAPTGVQVRAPAAGVVAFRGVVVDRPLVTIDHGGGIVSTFEPVESDLAAGAAVGAGDVIGSVGTGGHTIPGNLHVGVRVNGVYINPMLMFGDLPRAILLPCCDAVTPSGARAGRSPRAVRTRRACRSGWYRGSRGRGSPARRADPRRHRADGSPPSAAARADRRHPLR